MNIKQTKIIVGNLPLEHSVLLKGVHGCGKTEVVRQISEEYWKMPCVELQGSQLSDVGDLVGLMRISPEGGSVWEPPYWYPKDGKPICLFLDELNRAEAPIRRAMMQLANDQKILDLKLPYGSRLIVAMNPEESGVYDVEEFDFAESSRFTIYDFEPTVEEGLDFFRLKKEHPAIISYLEINPTQFDPPKKMDAQSLGTIQPCRRSWRRASQALIKFEKTPEFDLDLMTILISGYVGMKIAMQFRQHYVNFENGLTAKDLIEAKDFKVHEKTLKDMMKKGAVEMVRFGGSVGVYLEENDDKLNDKTGDLNYINLVAKNLYLFFDILTPELKSKVFQDVVRTANEKNLNWERSLHRVDERLKEMYIKIISVENQL